MRNASTVSGNLGGYPHGLRLRQKTNREGAKRAKRQSQELLFPTQAGARQNRLVCRGATTRSLFCPFGILVAIPWRSSRLGGLLLNNGFERHQFSYGSPPPPRARGVDLWLNHAPAFCPAFAGSTSVIAASLPSFKTCSDVVVANICIPRATIPVHPVWWLAPSPAPLSPWKYS